MKYTLLILVAFAIYFLISILLAIEITRHYHGGDQEFVDNFKYSLFILLFIIAIPELLAMMNGYFACIWLIFVFAPYGIVGIFEKSVFKNYRKDNQENSFHPFTPHIYFFKKLRS
ncbi:MAG: hypothetical protein ACMUJM_17525 [bacterium]